MYIYLINIFDDSIEQSDSFAGAGLAGGIPGPDPPLRPRASHHAPHRLPCPGIINRSSPSNQKPSALLMTIWVYLNFK